MHKIYEYMKENGHVVSLYKLAVRRLNTKQKENPENSLRIQSSASLLGVYSFFTSMFNKQIAKE